MQNFDIQVEITVPFGYNHFRVIRLAQEIQKRGSIMKRFFTRLLATILATLLVTFAMEGFDKITAPGKINKLSGTYVTSEALTTDTVNDILTRNDFYPEEIELIDLNSLSIPKYVEFRSDKTYTFYYDADGYRSSVKEFYRTAYARLYENRAQLSQVYGEDFTSMSEYEFQAYYAALYSCSYFEELLDTLTSNSWDYIALAQDREVGTFTIEDGQIAVTINGQFTAETIGYSLSGSSLTLTYTNGVENYTRCN